MSEALDEHLTSFLRQLEKIVKKDIDAARVTRHIFRNPTFIIHISETAAVLKQSSSHDEFSLSLATLEEAGLGQLRDVMKEYMPAIGYPISLCLEFEGATRDGHKWAGVRLNGIGCAGYIMGVFGSRSNDLLIPDRYSSCSYSGGLDRIAEGIRLIDGLIPRSNREVRSWSSISHLMTTFSHNENVHARTESEFILKMRLFHHGLNAIRSIVKNRRIEPMRNEADNTYSSMELCDLDVDPIGRTEVAVDFMNEINHNIETLSEPSENTPT